MVIDQHNERGQYVWLIALFGVFSATNNTIQWDVGALFFVRCHLSHNTYPTFCLWTLWKCNIKQNSSFPILHIAFICRVLCTERVILPVHIFLQMSEPFRQWKLVLWQQHMECHHCGFTSQEYLANKANNGLALYSRNAEYWQVTCCCAHFVFVVWSDIWNKLRDNIYCIFRFWKVLKGKMKDRAI